MTGPPTTVFLKRSDASDELRLRRAPVIEAAGERLTVLLDGPARGGDLQVYYEHRGAFVRRTARAVATDRVAEGTVIELDLIGTPVPAERRRRARVSYLDVYSRLVRELAPAGDPQVAG